MNSFLCVFELVACDLELVVELGDRVGRQSEVLLGISHFVSQGGVLGQEFLELLLVGLGLLVVGGESALVLAEFVVELGNLVGR